ncbi:MAG TPA: thioredoxin family protein [Desulfitobacterium dehalogenans]|uniref:Thioredoxin family protein n=1 Tax=Desulfitobacterium dehalogenans TaxID=36854 RepID=A0A7C7D5D5_9FIRM|nr:thioredoxin family protein [Desulfitobacterium dehalogenans]
MRVSLQKLDVNLFEQNIYDKGEACLVVFSRKSCHVCKEVVPVLEEMALKHGDKFGFYYVDVEEEKEVFERFSLKGVPQILFFHEGEYQGKVAGLVDEEEIEGKIAAMLER